MSGNNVIELPADKFEEFLDKFSDYLDTERGMVTDDNGDRIDIVTFQRIPKSLEMVSDNLKRLTDVLKDRVVQNNTPNTATETLQNPAPIQLIERHTRDTAGNTDVIWEETAEEFQRNLKRESISVKLLEEIRDSINHNSGAIEGISSPTNSFDRMIELTRQLTFDNIELLNLGDKQLQKQNEMVENLLRIDNQGRDLEYTTNRNHKEGILSLGNMFDSMKGVFEKTARDSQQEDQKQQKDKRKKDDAFRRIQRVSWAKIDNHLQQIKGKIIDPRLFMAFAALKNVFSGLSSIGGLFVKGVPKLGKGLLTGLLTPVISTVFNPKLLMNLIRPLLLAGGPIGLAVRAVGTGFYIMFKDEIHKLFNEVIELFKDPQRLQDFYNSVEQSVIGMYEDSKEWVSDIVSSISNTILSGVNNVIGFFAQIGPQFELLSVELNQRLREMVLSIPLIGETVSKSIGLIETEYNKEVERLKSLIAEKRNTDYVGINQPSESVNINEPSIDVYDYITMNSDALKQSARAALDSTIDAFDYINDRVTQGLTGENNTEAIRQVGRSTEIDNLNNQIRENSRQERVNQFQQTLMNNQSQVINNQNVVRPIEPTSGYTREGRPRAGL